MTKVTRYLLVAMVAALSLASSPVGALADINLEMLAVPNPNPEVKQPLPQIVSCIGEFIDVQVTLMPGSDAFNGYDLIVKYNSSMLEFVSGNEGQAMIDACGSRFAPTVTDDVANGEVIINGHVLLCPSSSISGVLYNLTFKVILDVDELLGADAVNCSDQCTGCPNPVPAGLTTAFFDDGTEVASPINCVGVTVHCGVGIGDNSWGLLKAIMSTP